MIKAVELHPTGAASQSHLISTHTHTHTHTHTRARARARSHIQVVELHPTGAAAQSHLISVGDTLLSVDGEDLQGYTGMHAACEKIPRALCTQKRFTTDIDLPHTQSKRSPLVSRAKWARALFCS